MIVHLKTQQIKGGITLANNTCPRGDGLGSRNVTTAYHSLGIGKADRGDITENKNN